MNLWVASVCTGFVRLIQVLGVVSHAMYCGHSCEKKQGDLITYHSSNEGSSCFSTEVFTTLALLGTLDGGTTTSVHSPRFTWLIHPRNRGKGEEHSRVASRATLGTPHTKLTRHVIVE